MTVRQRLARSNICMFLIPLLIAALLLLLGGGIALYILETTYLPRLGRHGAAADGFDLEAESAKGILDVWSFGPALLDGEGKSISGFTDTVAGANPRSSIGYYEPGHYCFVAVDGRDAEGSYGYTLDELSMLFEDLGCEVAYNLEGGQSSAMVWDGGSVTVNMPAGGGRPVGNIIYIAKE